MVVRAGALSGKPSRHEYFKGVRPSHPLTRVARWVWHDER
jgi:hypothetical protein